MHNKIILLVIEDKHSGIINAGGFMSKAKTVKSKEESLDEQVALYSHSNLFWNEVGKLSIGYNIVSAENAEKWLRHKAVRKATPEEVAKAYGV